MDVKGRIRIPYDDEEGNKSDESDDEDNDMWLDYSDDGGGRVRSKKPKVTLLSIIDATGKKHSCRGRFPLTHIYWTVRVKINKMWLQFPPAYSIVQDNGLKPYHVQLFLDDCMKDLKSEIKRPVKACFDIFCGQNLAGEALTFFNLESALKSFMASEGETCSFLKYPGSNNVGKWTPDNHGDTIESCVFESGTGLGCTGLRAVSHPRLVECVSCLLPYSFQDYLCKLKPQKLDLAQTMAVDSPWEFCFRQILYTKLKLSGAEAYLSTYDKAGYLPRTPLMEKDALHIYDVLKVDQKDGHMYMPFRTLTNYYYFKKLNYVITTMKRWKEALDYLEENKVIVREEFDQDSNLFLFHNWKAEMDTVKGFQTVLSKYQPEGDNLDADLDSSDFDKVRGDCHQLKASRLISSLPIVVLSGMGGCGKTTVVTNLLKHICDRHEKSLKKGEEEELSQQLQETALQDEISQAVETTQNNNKSNLSKSGEITNNHCLTDEEEEKEACGSKEGERSFIVETRAARLLRELREDLTKILMDKKDLDGEEMARFKKQILLVAPTGKAARLLGCKARLPSATIHSVVMSWRSWRDPKNAVETKEWTYCHVKILVVDECSLLSVRLFAAIVSILLEYANLSKLVLLGDIKQLPSIEPGDFLRDIFKAFSKPSFSVELTQNHRSESMLIVENAKRISKNQLPTFDPEQRFYFVELDEEGGDNERDQAINHLLHQNGDLQSHIQSQFVSFRNAHCRAINELCCKHYNKHSILTTTKRSKEVMYFEPGDKICFGKTKRVVNHEKILDEYTIDIRRLIERNSKHSSKNGGNETETQETSFRSRSESQKDGNRTGTGLSAAEVTSLFAGDEGDLDRTVSDLRQKEVEASAQRDERRARAAQRKKEWEEKHKGSGGSGSGQEKKDTKKSSSSPNEEKLCNGEVFFVMDEKQVTSDDGKVANYLILSDRDPVLPRVVCVAEKALRKDCKMKHSWVRTIHTYQGSESDTVVYFLGPAIPQNWQHVYTAVTRGKKSVYIIGKRSQLSIAVTRQARPRNSRLRHRLDDMLTSYSEDVQKLRAANQSMSRGQSDPDTSLASSFENGDDSWIASSMPDPYFTQEMNPEVSSQMTTNNKQEDAGQMNVMNDGLKGKSKHKTSSVVKKEMNDIDIDDYFDSDDDDYKQSTVLKVKGKSKHKTSSLVKKEKEKDEIEIDIDDYFASGDDECVNINDNQNGAATSTTTTTTTAAANNCLKSPQKREQSVSSSHSSPNRARTPKPKKTPPRPSSSLLDFQSPPKQTRQNDPLVDTPFRNSFKSTLSLDPNELEEEEEDPILFTPRDSVKRKIL